MVCVYQGWLNFQPFPSKDNYFSNAFLPLFVGGVKNSPGKCCFAIYIIIIRTNKKIVWFNRSEFVRMLTLFPTAYWFPLCYGVKFTPPPAKNIFRSVIFQFFYTYNESYIQLAKIKKISKTAEKSEFKKKFRNFALWAVITKMSAIRPKFNILSSSFLQTSLFL